MIPSRKVLPLLAFWLLVCACSGCGNSSSAVPTVSVEEEAGDGGAAARAAAWRPVVALVTNLGEITVELNREHAPLTVDNFLYYASKGVYNNTIFHQVDKGFMALAGGFDTELHEIGTDFPIRNEAHNGLKNHRGTLAMGRRFEAVDSATSQFFFNLADNADLDHRDESSEGYGYCVFGRVIAGMDVVDRIGKVPVQDVDGFQKIPVEMVVLQSVRRVK